MYKLANHVPDEEVVQHRVANYGFELNDFMDNALDDESENYLSGTQRLVLLDALLFDLSSSYTDRNKFHDASTAVRSCIYLGFLGEKSSRAFSDLVEKRYNFLDSQWNWRDEW